MTEIKLKRVVRRMHGLPVDITGYLVRQKLFRMNYSKDEGPTASRQIIVSLVLSDGHAITKRLSRTMLPFSDYKLLKAVFSDELDGMKREGVKLTMEIQRYCGRERDSQ